MATAGEGSWWSRAWGGVALVACATHFGAAVYEAAVVAPLWTAAPPDSVVAWASSPLRPDSSGLFHPLVALVCTATTIAWISSLATSGRRRWWLTLAEACSLGLAWVVVIDLIPLERELFFGATVLGAGKGAADVAGVVAMTGEWLRASALRLAALALGGFALHRAHRAGLSAGRAPGASRGEGPARAERSDGGRSRREFTLGDEDEDDVLFGDEAAARRASGKKAATPRSRWRGSISRPR